MNRDEILKHKALLEKQLWAIADELRGNMDASEYQKYMLGILFYKYLSELSYQKATEILDGEGLTFEEAWAKPEYQAALKTALLQDEGYYIEPEHLYHNLIAEINKGSQGNWSTDLLDTAFNHLISSTAGTANQNDFEGLFDDINLTSNGLGGNPEARNQRMGKIIQKIGEINFLLGQTEIDVLGDAYEYLIGQFASGAGKKGGEFYTPPAVSRLVSQILAIEKPNFESVYDPTCGSGSLLLRIAKESKARKELITLYGQELNTTTYNLARMNMILHEVKLDRFEIKNGNTLENDLHAGVTVDVIGANPPYSAKWEHTTALEQDPRYAPYGKLAPKDKADYAFVLNMLHHLKDDGVAAVVLPHGVLFRGGAEGAIRKSLVERNLIHAVIGLPSNLFYGTSIPTCILVLKKGRKDDEKVLFIDSSNNFDKGKNQNFLSEINIQTILDAYKVLSLSKDQQKVQEKFSALVTRELLAENDYNLNIPRYVETAEAEKLIDLNLINLNFAELAEKERQIQEEINKMNDEILMGITHTDELEKIFESKGIQKIDTSEIKEAGLYFIVKRQQLNESVKEVFAQNGIQFNAGSISAFIGYGWGDEHQDYKIEHPNDDWIFYQLLLSNRKEASFEETVISFLDTLNIRCLKRQQGVIGTSPILKFSKEKGSAWGEFELKFLDTSNDSGDSEFYLAYPYKAYSKIIDGTTRA